MSEFVNCKDAVDFIKEIRLNNLDDWKFSQKLLEIEGMIKSYYESEDYSICDDCSKVYKEDVIDEIKSMIDDCEDFDDFVKQVKWL